MVAEEIERKFLLCSDGWRKAASGALLRQGYLCSEKERTVRVRVLGEEGAGLANGPGEHCGENPGGESRGRAYLTIKGLGDGICRPEFEYEIPYADGLFMLERLAQRPLVEKRRYRIPVDGFVWEVDEFLGENAGLVVAEIELADPEQVFPRPEWLGEEVTHDPRYANANLIRCPFSAW